MSALSSIGDLSSVSSGLPAIDQATEPAAIRNGDQAAKNAYQTGLGFEEMLDNELTTQLSATVSGTGSGDDGLGGTSEDGSADPAASAFSSMMPGALTSGLMTSGGTGIAMQIAQSLDPALNNPTTATAGASGSGVTTSTGGVAPTPSGAASGLTTATQVGV